MSGRPNFRMLVRNLRLMDEAKKAGKCHACGRELPKTKPAASPAVHGHVAFRFHDLDADVLERWPLTQPTPSVVSTPEPQPEAACDGLTWNLLDEICSEFGPPEYVETEDGEGWYWRFAGYELPVGDHLSDIIQFAAEKLSQRATLERPPVATPEPTADTKGEQQ